MSLFTIDTVEYPVTLPFTVNRKKLDHQRRAFSGKMRSALHDDTNTVARSWEVTLGHLTTAQTQALKTALTGTGTVDIAGDLIGATVTCEALDVTRKDGQISNAIVKNVLFEEVLS